MVGEVLADRYTLEELVGTGGMSSVYRAHDALLDRKVALKILHLQYMGDGQHVERFRREARSVATLSHPNIVTVIDRGEFDGREFIVFEYVDGENLKRLIERTGPMPVEQALELALQIASALLFAHQHGLVHRDVKPQNVLLNGDGRAKVTDFGIARSLDVQHGMTQTGTVLGTSYYIAPEQAQGKPIDERTDVYSLSVVLYELLTGEVPFPGENFVAVAMRHINEEPPPVRDRRPDLSPRLEAAVTKALAKEPSARFAAMGDFGRELEACLAEARGAEADGTQIIPPRRVVRSRRRFSPWPVLLLLGGLLAIGVVVAAALLRDHGSPAASGPPSSSSGSVRLTVVTAFDPYGNPPGEENNDSAHLATDGKADTYWSTEHYHATFAELRKQGVGLVLDAHKVTQLHEVGVVTNTPGFTTAVLAGDSPTGPFGVTVSPPQEVGDSARFPISTGAHRYYLLWITKLPPSGTGVAHVNEVKAN
jgi:serine/threonine-protein kinase